MRLNLTIVILTTLISSTINGQYIKVIKDGVSIRNGASLTNPIICQAKIGDIFEIKNKTGDWISINIGFGKEPRFINSSLCEEVLKLPQLPDKMTCKNIFLDFRRCEQKAQKSADSEITSSNQDYLNLLKEAEGKYYSRYLMDTFHKYNLTPALYTKIVELGFKEGWNNLTI